MSQLELKNRGTSKDKLLDFVLALPVLSFLLLTPVYIFYFTYLKHFSLPINLNLDDALTLFVTLCFSNGTLSGLICLFIVLFIFILYQSQLVRFDYVESIYSKLKAKLDKKLDKIFKTCCFFRLISNVYSKFPWIRNFSNFIFSIAVEFFKMFGLFVFLVIVAKGIDFFFGDMAFKYLATFIFAFMISIIPILIYKISTEVEDNRGRFDTNKVVLLNVVVIVLASIFIQFLSNMTLSLDLKLSTFDKKRYLILSGRDNNFIMECYDGGRASLLVNQGLHWNSNPAKHYRDFDNSFSSKYCK